MHVRYADADVCLAVDIYVDADKLVDADICEHADILLCGDACRDSASHQIGYRVLTTLKLSSMAPRISRQPIAEHPRPFKVSGTYFFILFNLGPLLAWSSGRGQERRDVG
jgi:hypothetical protein